MTHVILRGVFWNNPSISVIHHSIFFRMLYFTQKSYFQRGLLYASGTFHHSTGLVRTPWECSSGKRISFGCTFSISVISGPPLFYIKAQQLLDKVKKSTDCVISSFPGTYSGTKLSFLFLLPASPICKLFPLTSSRDLKSVRELSLLIYRAEVCTGESSVMGFFAPWRDIIQQSCKLLKKQRRRKRREGGVCLVKIYC